MRKFFGLFIAVLIGFFTLGCGSVPEEIAMTDLDEYLFQEDWQFVDLRNFDDQMADGWIRGFEMIPYFQYLEYENILVRTGGNWDFEASQIKDEAALRELFDEDRNIVLICAAGARAGYVQAALEHLGYENVWNAGALGNYSGKHRVLGDGSFKITLPHRAMVDPLPSEINSADAYFDFYVSREDVQFVDLRNFEDKLESGWHAKSTVVPFFSYLENEDILVRLDGWNFSPSDIKDEQILRNIFDQDKNIILICRAGTRAGYVKAALEELGYENVWNVGGLGDYEGPLLINPNCAGDTNDTNGNGDCE